MQQFVKKDNNTHFVVQLKGISDCVCSCVCVFMCVMPDLFGYVDADEIQQSLIAIVHLSISVLTYVYVSLQ